MADKTLPDHFDGKSPLKLSAGSVRLMLRLEPVRLGVIGGTGFYSIKDFNYVAEVNPLTPWGYPSSPITIALSPKGTPVAFLARHGRGHIYSPSEVPSRANIAALKHLGVNAIVSFSAVGSLQHHIRPRDFLVPNQIIDRTRGIRPGTFFEKGLVGHAMFAEPFDVKMEKIVWKAAGSLQGGSKLHTTETDGGKDVTLVCMEGPCFSTRAESHMYRSFGGSVINMYLPFRVLLTLGLRFQRPSLLVRLRLPIK